MKRADLDEFVSLYKSGALYERQPTWSEARSDGLDLFWLKDESLLDAENLPEPDEIAAEIAEDLRSALAQIEEILGDLGASA